MKIGVIGMGGLGTLHFNNLMKIPQVQVTAICDIRPERLVGDFSKTATNLDRRSEDYDLSNIAKFEDYRQLLKTDVEAVVIATPTFLHAEMAIAAMQAGKHVFCEKPMALNSTDAAAMAVESKKSGRNLQIGHVLRFFPEYVMVKAMIDDGRYGKVTSIECRRNGGFPGWSWNNWFNKPELSGGASVDLHIHDVDVLNWWLGVPKAVSSQVVWDQGGPSQILTQYRYDAVPLVHSHGAWTPGPVPFRMGFVMAFERATLMFGLGSNPPMILFENDATDPVAINVPPADGYAVELEYFIDCCAKGKGIDRLPPEEVAQSLRIVEAELRSSKSGQWETV